MSEMQWRVTGSVLVLDEHWARVRRDACVLPNGKTIDDYYYWEGNDFAQVFALDQYGQVILTQQYKHGVKEIVTELPAGLISTGDSNPLAAAKRELAEETGYTGVNWRSLGLLNVSSAKATTRAYPFLVTDVSQTQAPHLDDTEQIRVLTCPIEQVIDMVCAGEIRDSNSLATCLRALRALGKI